MKKSIKSVLAKSLAVVMAFSLAGIAPSTSSDAASKKPTLPKKVTVNVGKKKTVKVKSKKKVKKTTWSLNKKGKKVVSLSKKKKKSVVVKGKKKGTATLTAKIKVGKKTYKKKCKITVKKATGGTTTGKTTPKPTTNTNTNTPGGNTPGGSTGGNKATPSPKPTEKPVDTFKTADGATLTVEEKDTYSVALTELNETTFTCASKRPADADPVADGTLYNRDGSVTFTSLKDYNSGVSFYVNPCTSEDQIVDISDTRGEGFLGYKDGTKDMSAYDYVRVKVTSANEMNFRTYNGNDQLDTAGFPGSSSSETYEGGWIETNENIWADESTFSAGNQVKDEYATRTIFIPISAMMEKGMNPESLTAIAICPQSAGVEVTIHRIDFVKVKYDKPVTGLTVTAKKAEIVQGKTTTVSAEVTPEDATRKIVKWSSSDESLATVNFAGTVVAASDKTGEVTITATATDGSGVTGSTKIKVTEPSAQPEVVKTHKVDLTKVVGKTNPGSGESVAATQTATSIEFMAGKAMAFVDFSKYLEDNKLDLSNYDELQVKWEVQDADGTKVTDYGEAEGKPTYGKIAYVASSKLNGYDDGIDVKYEGPDDAEVNKGWLAEPFTGGTCVLTIAKTNPAELATVAGFNLQLSGLPANMHIVVTDITLFKDNNVNVDLTKVVAKTNPGQGESIAATQSAAGIDFLLGGNMLFVNMSNYLTENNIDISEFAGMEVSYQLKNEDGSNADAYTDVPGWGNFALVKESDLNGYVNPGILKGNLGNKIADTATFDFSVAEKPAEIGLAAGFNLQLEKMDADKYISITKITLISK